MKRKRKPGKICAALAVGIFLAICGMSGCGRGGSDSENSDNTAEASEGQEGNKEYDLTSGSWKLDEEVETSAESWAVTDYWSDYMLESPQKDMRLSKRVSTVGGSCYYILERYTAGGNVGPGCQKYYLTCLDMEGLKAERKELKLQGAAAGSGDGISALSEELARDLDENWLIVTGMSVADGKLCLLALQMSREEKAPACYYVIWLDGEGRMESALDLLPAIQQAGMQEGNSVPEGLLYDGSGYYYVGMEDGTSGIGVFDKEGSCRKQVGAPYGGGGTVYPTGCLPDGRPVFECRDPDGVKTILFCLEDLEEKILYHGKCDAASVRLPVIGGEVFYAGSRGIVRWDVETGKQERIYQDTSLNPWLYEALCKTEDGGVAVVSHDGEYTFAQKLMPGAEVEERKVTLYMLYDDQSMKGYADEYSRWHPGISIEIEKPGSGEGDDDAALLRFAAQLMSGEGPDMFVMRRGQLETLQAKGVLAELAQYLPEEVTGQVFPAVLEAGTVDGKLYGIALQCYVNTLAVSESLWQGRTWDYPDIISLMEAGEASGDGPKSVMDGHSSEKLLDILANISISAGKSSLVDEKAGKCYFDTEEFVGLLEFCKKYGMDPGSVSGEEELIHSCSGNLVSFSMMMAELGEEYHCVGYPVNSGSGGFVEYPFLVGVNDKTENREIVSDFLQYLLSERKQNMSGGASVRKDVLCSGVMEHSTYSEGAVYMDTAGGYRELASKPDGSSFLPEYLEVLENAAPLPTWREQIEGVVLEESQAYFKGDKTAEDVASIIQNRVQLFLDE